MTGFPEEHRDTERIRLLEADLASTNDFVKSVITTGASIRGMAITLWLALLGFAVQQELAVLAYLAASVAVVFWFLDGYHGWLYYEASRHARACERLLSSYFNAVGRFRDDPTVAQRFRAELRAHTYGLFFGVRNFTLRKLWLARPRILYLGLYITLAGMALVLGAMISSGGFAAAVDSGLSRTDPGAQSCPDDNVREPPPRVGPGASAQLIHPPSPD
jgi:hypothetical protein